MTRTGTLSIVSALFAIGCAQTTTVSHRAKRLSVRVLGHHVEKPSNLAIFFTVHGDEGQPVVGIGEQEVRVREGSRSESPTEAAQLLLSPLPSTQRTLILVDRSRSVTEERHQQQLRAAVDAVMRRASDEHRVAVYAFDGSEGLTEIERFTTSPSIAGERVANVRPRDPSTNLNGAIVRASDLLSQEVSRADTALRFGTLMLVSDGTDRADRVSAYEMRNALDSTGVDEVVVVGIGSELDPVELKRLAHKGAVLLDPDPAVLPDRLNEVFDGITRRTQAYYQLSYCSPARAGEQTLHIEVERDDARGSGTQSFDADGFGPGCDPAAIKPPIPDLAGHRR